jgi:hypothetical protein
MSIARSTPAQKPRGCANTTFMITIYSDQRPTPKGIP